MSNDGFIRFHRAIAPQFLEEAQNVTRRRIAARPLIYAAACICAVLAGIGAYVFFGRVHHSPSEALPESVTVGNPVSEVTRDDLAALGYDTQLPEDADNVRYMTIDMGKAYASPMAQISFTIDGDDCTYRAVHTDTPEDISGVYVGEDVQPMVWLSGDMEIHLCEGEDDSWISWFEQGDDTQRCLISDGQSYELIGLAQEIAAMMGHSIYSVPEGAVDARCDAFRLGDYTVGETTFTLDGVRYNYRTAFIMYTEFADISGIDDAEFDQFAEGEILWCPARLSFDEGGAGKIIWLDVVPGLSYSLTVESGASKDFLIEAAKKVFVPSQEPDYMDYE